MITFDSFLEKIISNKMLQMLQEIDKKSFSSSEELGKAKNVR